MGRVILDSFSGPASDLKPAQRTAENVLAALARNPMVSTWDMSECGWLRSIIGDLQRQGRITEQPSEYPWHRFVPTTQEQE